MKRIHATFIVMLIVMFAHHARSDASSKPTFLKIGSTYHLQMSRDVNRSKPVRTTTTPPKVTTLSHVKVLEHGGGSWFKVEYIHKWYDRRMARQGAAVSTNLPPPVMLGGWKERTERKWLNFDFVISAVEVEKEEIEQPKP